MPSVLVVLLHYSFYFKKLHSQLLISSGCTIILALKALCNVRGGALRCLTALADSALALGCPGWAALLISADLCWATGPLTAGWNLLIHIRKHQPYHIYIDMILINLPGASSHLGTEISANVKETVFNHLVMELTQRHMDRRTSWGEQKPSQTRN